MLSKRFRYPSRPNKYNNTPENIITGQSNFTDLDLTGMGKIRADNPRTRPIFEIFDPITFPKAISGCPLSAALKLTNSSGAEVPSETIVNPTTKVEILNLLAKQTPPFTKKCPLASRMTKPTRISR